jgi:hypothetical protein
MASLLSKIKIGEVTYDLKDATARADLATEIGKLGTAAYKAADTTVTGSATGVATTAAVKSYVDSAVGKINQFEYEVVESLPEASADTMYKIYLVAIADASSPDAYAEYITLRSGTEGDYTYAFEKIGDTNLGLSGYVPTSRTVAGLALSADISAAALKTALGLGSLAYKSSASATVDDYVTGITGASYTPAGTVANTITTASTAISSTGNFTPAGTVTGSVTPTGSVTLAKTTSTTAGVAISGTVSAPAITVTANTTTVPNVTGVGTLPSYTEASYTPPSVTEAKSAFATSGVTASVGSGDDAETLIIGTASTANALTSTGFDAGSFTDGTFSAGTLPTLGSAITVATGIKTASASAPEFTGDRFEATFAGTSDTISASFTGTQGSVSVSGNYDKVSKVEGAFTGTAATVTPTLTKGNKTITVS